VLVKDEATGANNGVYTVTQVGDASNPYILTRATDFDTAGSGVDQIDQGDFFLVISGTVNANTSWVQQTPLPITVGTTALVFIEFAAVQTYTAGTGLSLITNQFSITNIGTAGTYGSASTVPVITTNAQGQVTGVTNTAIAIAGSAVTGNITGNAANVTGIVAVANGGTGTATPALVAGTNVSITGTWPNQTINSSNPGGTVTSVAATVPAFLSVTGSPITSSGTLAISYSGTALPIANGGTGQTASGAAFNALSPITSTGDLIIGNGTNSATRLGIGANNYVLTSNGTTAVWAVASGSGATIVNDTTTATNIYPLFAAATSGSLSTVNTGDTKLLYKPSTGEFTSSIHISSNGIQVNSKTVSTSYTIATGNSGMSAGPITIASGQTVTVASGSRWVVL
jgi:trimeric autotransporter adhesin